MIEDQNRVTDLQNMLKRMGGVSAVFRVRSEIIGCPGVLAFSELMDAYIELCRRNLTAGNDFARGPLAIDDQMRTELVPAFVKVFGQEPAQVLQVAQKPEA